LPPKVAPELVITDAASVLTVDKVGMGVSEVEVGVQLKTKNKAAKKIEQT
jgi:hypothetical protein